MRSRDTPFGMAARTLARAVLVAFVVATVAFSILRLAPGDPVSAILGDQATPEAMVAMRAKLGLDGSIVEQYFRFIGGAVQGDFGRSVTSGANVSTIISRSIRPTLLLIGTATTMAFLLAIPTGLVLAMHPKGWFSRASRLAFSVLLSTPGFFLGLLALMLFAVRWDIAPVAGFDTGFPDFLEYAWLPALVICGTLVPILTRVFRASVSRTMDEEFVEAAIVRGVSRPRFIWSYLVRPSVAPTVALMGYLVGQMLGSAVMIEMVFGIPGIGTEIVRAVSTRDYPTVQGILLVFGIIVVIVSTVSNLFVRKLDHRAANPS